ncbi:MAG: exosortase K [Myxococcales bacterium]|nr:exosortase K [Myxococcales bacterium]
MTIAAAEGGSLSAVPFRGGGGDRVGAAWARHGAQLLALVIAYALKAFYSRAGADELLFVLAPSSWLARTLGGVELVHESGAGFISHADRLVVGPACAGLNFFIICFVVLSLSFSAAFARRADDRRAWGRRALLWVGISLGISFAATVFTNGVRISLAARLYQAEIYGDLLTRERAHRLLGTVIYYASLLCVLTLVAHRLSARVPRLMPLAGYVGILVLAPLLCRAHRSPGFWEHGVWVASTAVVLTTLGWALSRLRWGRGRR